MAIADIFFVIVFPATMLAWLLVAVNMRLRGYYDPEQRMPRLSRERRPAPIGESDDVHNA